nr:hypothetical protein [Tanacetum cinerariifolium]
KAVFANGCLHWLASYSDFKTRDGGQELIWFDVNKEEFGLIERPKHHGGLALKPQEWVPHCQFKEIVPDRVVIDVIGCWNKDGDILIRSICGNPVENPLKEGENSWREIPQVPSYPISGKAVYANGCLHWLASYTDIKTEDGGRPIIWFDVEKEDFGLIDPPKRMCDKDSCRYQVDDLNGEVGYMCTRTMEVWLLKHKKEWVPHCRFKEKIVPHGFLIDVIGCWNKDGDILIKIINGDPLSSIVRIVARGSCDGMICLAQDDGHVITSLVVIHPLRKECYELPRLPLCLENPMRRESCGLGFDALANTYKMVCVLLKEYAPPNKPDMVKKNLCTMVHVFGINSWREIPQVPSYPITGLNGQVLSAAFNSTWSSIINEVNSLKDKCVDLISHCKIKKRKKHTSVADKMRTSISFSFRRPVRGGVESQQHDHLSVLLDSVILSNMEDRWFWDLNGDGVFRVKDVRILLDEAFLPKMEVPTLWIKSIPIKVNVFAWKLFLDRLPTRSNLAQRNVSIPSLACPLCDLALEDSFHLFFGCFVAKDTVVFHPYLPLQILDIKREP